MSEAPRSSPGDGEALVRRSWIAGSMTQSSVDVSLSGTVVVARRRIGNEGLISEWLGSLVVCESIGTGVMLNS
jgi:hypothetical protein